MKKGRQAKKPIVGRRKATESEQERRLLQTLHQAETKQLESFIQTRSTELDRDIKKLRSQLKGVDHYGQAGLENHDLAVKSSSVDLNIRGHGLGHVEFKDDHSSYNQKPVMNSTMSRILEGKVNREQPKTMNDQLILLLAKMKLKMEDVHMSPVELKELLLPSDLMLPDEHSISIRDLTGVLQTDLLMPVTKNDQLLLLRAYGTGVTDDEVDIRGLLSDAGIWSDGRGSRRDDNSKTIASTDEKADRHATHDDKHHNERNNWVDTRDHLRASTLPVNQAQTNKQLYTYPSSDKRSRTKDMLDSSSRHLDELAQLHQMILDDREFDEESSPLKSIVGTAAESHESIKLDNTDEQNSSRSNYYGTSSKDRMGDRKKLEAVEEERASIDESIEDKEVHDSGTKGGALGVSDGVNAKLKREEEQLVDNRVSALQRENDRLKKEMESFDSEFFEQLEDLKYRYSKLQEVVGEDPASTRAIPLTDPRIRGGGLPLDRLSWSVRSAMTAMDRAGLTSPLVNRPIYPNAYTYSPGTELKNSNKGHGAHVGGTIPAHISSQSSQQYPPFLTHKGNGTGAVTLGGQHAIGAGIHSIVPDEHGGTFSNLCERRLAFELTQHRTPEQATRSLIHRIIDAAGKNDGFVTCPQLVQIFQSLSLRMSPAEIEILATGFASDGKGGVNADELCQVVRTLLYNLVGEHAGVWSEVQARMNGVKDLNSNREQERILRLRELMTEICEGILAFDRRAVLGNSKNIYKTLLRPFVESDESGSGHLTFKQFSDVLKDIGCLLTHQDLVAVAKSFIPTTASTAAAAADSVVDPQVQASHPSSNLNHIQSFRDAKLKGTLKGAAMSNPVVGEWLSSSGIGLEDYYGDRNGNTLGNKESIDYNAFVSELAEIMSDLLDQRGGVVMANQFPWILREFELVDTLICQLEEMNPPQRRKMLMSLQYALSAADPKQECELDGFTVLNALLSCGFRLQRVNRVRLLRAVEELGGKMDYRDLCQVLLNSCADWTVDEKHVVQKILKSMGVTVIERRNWLAKLRQTLHEASARMARKTGRWFAAEVGSNTSNLSHGTSSDEQTMGITPATFLHCLRDCGIALNVDEEATLLDCLDTERLAKLGQLELEQGEGKSKGFGSDSWSIPTVEYESFLQFCARHCGSWVDAAPQIHDALQRTMESISNPILAVHEFASLLHAFDEVNIGSVSKRAFQICCHRSRLLANLPDDISNSLADILTVDGGGKVEYTSFIIYLRTLCSRISDSSSASPDVPSIINQLIRNATDSKGTLLPLRNWMIRHCDMESFMMTMKDLNALLREFSVMYRPQDLEALVMDIGQVVVQSRSIMKDKSQKSEKMSSTSSQPTKNQVVDARDLMIHILKSRPRWTTNHPYLCKRMLNAMKTSGNSQLGAPISNGGGSLQHMDGNEWSYDSNGNYYEKKGSINGARGIETAVARRILTRLRAFTGRSSANIGAVDHDTKARDELNVMVERYIFKHLAAVTGLPLSDEDVLVLADATDFLPEATRIRCDVILDVLLMDHSKHSSDGDGDGTGFDDNRAVVIDANTIGRPLKVQQSESGLFALDHLKDLLWRNATRLHRTNLEWIADVRTVFAGFDKGGNGLISSEDFTMALWLLNSTVSNDILQDISYIPEGRGLVDYTEILKYILVPPKSKSGLEIQTKSIHSGSDGKHSGGNTDRSISSGKNVALLSVKAHSKSNKDSPVELLVNVVRRSIHRFIVSDHTLETAWVCLLKAFQRFDPQETNQVTPRDFCLAVSVLLDGDDIVLTKSEWATIIDHFVTLDEGTDKNDKMKKTRQVNFLGGAMVDYMLFCEVVLNPAEVKSRLTDSRGTGKAETRIDKGKKFLSKSVNKKDTFHDRGDYEGSAAPLSLQGTSTLPSSSRNKASSSSSVSNRGLQISPQEDEIVRRFRDIATSSGKSDLLLSDAPSGGGRLGYNNAGASVDAYQSEKSNGPHKKSAWNTDELYRTVRTKEQANHASARGKTVSLSSARDNYASSHSNRGTTTKPSSRFNWTK